MFPHSNPMPTLATTVDGLKLPNPFLIASGPPGTNLNVIRKAFREGWGAVVAKTVSLDAGKVVNVTPRYSKLYSADRAEIIGWENIELISDRRFDLWLDEFKRCKDEHPDGVLIASIMEEYSRDAWVEIVERCEAAGVDAFELNFSCPHGLPERRMGAAMGQDPELLEEVCGWVMGAGNAARLGEDDAQRHAHRGPQPRRAARRLPGRQRDQHDPLRRGRRSRHVAPRADRRGLHDARRIFRPRRAAHRAADGHGNRHHDPARISRSGRFPGWAASRAATTRRNSSCSARTRCRSARA